MLRPVSEYANSEPLLIYPRDAGEVSEKRSTLTSVLSYITTHVETSGWYLELCLPSSLFICQTYIWFLYPFTRLNLVSSLFIIAPHQSPISETHHKHISINTKQSWGGFKYADEAAGRLWAVLSFLCVVVSTHFLPYGTRQVEQQRFYC